MHNVASGGGLKRDLDGPFFIGFCEGGDAVAVHPFVERVGGAVFA